MNRWIRAAAATLVACTFMVVAVGVAQAAPAPSFVPAASASIHPGVMTMTKGAQCTSNFVFYDASTVYLGQAAHCSGTGGAQETNGCSAKSLPVGTPVDVQGASKPGRLAYNSWVTMQQLGEKDSNACQYNDLALVAIDPADAGKVSPSIPRFGLPTGLITDGVKAGASVRSYGNSQLRGGIARLSPKSGVSLGQDSGGWNHTVFTLTPGIPGDSGSGFIDAEGRAFGVLSTLSLLPLPAANGVGDLARELAYMRAHGGPAAVLADSTHSPAPDPTARSAAKLSKRKPTRTRKAAARKPPKQRSAGRRGAVKKRGTNRNSSGIS